MDHTFDTVDEKMAETEFFLRKMAEVGLDFFAFNCFLSAYLSASRTTTLALQQFKHIPGFEQWYKPHQEHLKANPLAKFFLDTRKRSRPRRPLSGLLRELPRREGMLLV